MTHHHLHAELETLAILAEAESMVIMAEARSGLNVPNGRRPTSKKEQKSKVRFGDLAAVMQNGYDMMAGAMAEFWETYTDQALDGIFQDAILSSADQATLAYGQVQQEVPENMLVTLYSAQDALLDRLELAYRVSEILHTLEAMRQGAMTPVRWGQELSTPRQRVRSQLAPLSRNVVHQAADRVMENVRSVVLTPQAVGSGTVDRRALELPRKDRLLEMFVGSPTGAQAGAGSAVASPAAEPASKNVPRKLVVDAGVTSPPISGGGDGLYRGFKGPLDASRQATHAAVNRGRADAAQHSGATHAFASEILDGNTCGPCQEIDGKDYKTMTEARDDYPQSGGYYACDGGARCRGTLIFLYEEGKRPMPLGDNPDGPEDPWDDIFGGGGGDTPPSSPPDGWQYPAEAMVAPDADDTFTGPLAHHRRAIKAADSPAGVRDALRDMLDAHGSTVEGTWSARSNLTTVKEFADSVVQNMERFPQAIPKSVSIRRLPDNAYAETRIDDDGTRHLTFNAAYATTGARRRFQADLSADVTEGFHHESTGTVHGVISHEFGHMIDAALDGRMSGYHVNGRGEWMDWMHEYTGGKWDGYGMSLPGMVDGYSGYSLDEYGMFHSPEFLAESFADVEANGRMATPLSQFVHRKMLEAYRDAGNTINKGSS
jgi:hypothetical protein